MPGASAATQSSRCGKSPNEPSRVSATIRETPVFSAKISDGRRILRFMRAGGMLDLRPRRFGLQPGLRLRWGGGGAGLRLGLRFVDGPDHIERALGVVFEF